MKYEDQNVMDALNEKFYQLIASGNSETSYLSIINGGYILSEKELAFLEDYNKNIDEAYYFSSLVNRIPKTIDNWSPTGSSMAFVYRNEFLERSKVPIDTLTPKEEKALKEAEDFLLNNHKEYRYYEKFAQKAQSDLNDLKHLDPKPTDYIARLLKLTQSYESAVEDWELYGKKNAYEKQRAIKNGFESKGYPDMKDALKKKYDLLYQTNQTTQGANFVPTMCIPGSFYKSDFQWNSYSFNSSETETYQSTSDRNWSAGARGSYNLFWGSADASGSEHREYKQVDTSGLEVKFDYIRIALDRSWFEPYLLTSRSWWWSGATRENPTGGGPVYSNGNRPPNTDGSWQMIPQDIIFVKNLEVKLDIKKEINERVLKELKASASVGFAFWKLAGANYSERSDEKYDFNYTEEGVIKAPQMQMCAFLCDLLPQEPNPDTTLMPENYRNHKYLF